MSIEVNVTGTGSWLGHVSNIGNYNVTESSTPIDPGDTSGATGSVDFTVDEKAAGNETLFLMNSDIELVDTLQGRIPGVVTGVSSNNGSVKITADSRLVLLHARVTALPHVGTLASAFEYYLSLAGITSEYLTDASVASTPVVLQGWQDDLWLRLKQLCAAYEVEISLVSGIIVLRPIRTRTAELGTVSDENWSVSNNQLAQYVQAYYYNNEDKSNALVFPVDVYDDTSIIQIGAGEDRTWEFSIRSTPLTVNKPLPQNSVNKFYSGPLSVYSIIDREEVPVTAAWWTANGGDVSVTVAEDYSKIFVRVISPTSPNGPFSFAGVEQIGDATAKYNTLKITGSGVFYNKQLLTGPTGAPLARTAQDVGTTVDNPNISTIADGYEALMKAVGKYASPSQTIDLYATVINRKGDSGQIQYPTFEDFNTANVGKTFAQFDVTWAGKTFSQFTAFYYAQVADTFENQAFGNSAGARARYGSAFYRIRSATIDPLGVRLSAERDTIFGDHNTRWAGNTFAQFDTRWAGKTFEDYAIAPLW